MKASRFFFVLHIGTLIFLLLGLLIASSNLELWNDSSREIAIFQASMVYFGSFSIVLGSLTLFLFGWFSVGPYKTMSFFLASVLISLSMELLGTNIGFPFGIYRYTEFPDWNMLGSVPYSIPLSWFYMGFSSFLLATAFVRCTNWKYQGMWSVFLGSCFLIVWILVLASSMAPVQMAARFWVWRTSAGILLQHLLGTCIVALCFIGAAQLLWNIRPITERPLSSLLPFGVYLANFLFALLLAIRSGLWGVVFSSVLFVLMPISLSMLVIRPIAFDASERHQRVLRSMRRLSAYLLSKRTTYTIKGMEHLPGQGPVMLVANHVHYLYDGCILLADLPRYSHILVGLDWARPGLQRRLLQNLCALAGWPVIFRERLHFSVLKEAMEWGTLMLKEQKMLVIFPEGYPLIDPHHYSQREEKTFHSFRNGAIRLIELAEQQGAAPIAIIPTRFTYRQTGNRWDISLELDKPVYRQQFESGVACLSHIEAYLRAATHVLDLS